MKWKGQSCGTSALPSQDVCDSLQRTDAQSVHRTSPIDRVPRHRWQDVTHSLRCGPLQRLERAVSWVIATQHTHAGHRLLRDEAPWPTAANGASRSRARPTPHTKTGLACRTCADADGRQARTAARIGQRHASDSQTASRLPIASAGTRALSRRTRRCFASSGGPAATVGWRAGALAPARGLQL
jgi:hypothetical protein